MAKPLKILEEAVTEGHQAWLWYCERSERAGRRYQQAFDKAIEQILENPERWPEYLLGTKTAKLKRYPYLIVFRELDDEIQVIAVAHAHRRPGYWKLRLK